MERATSREAADAIRPVAAKLRMEVLTFLLSRGHHGATDEEIQEHLAMPGNTERPRRGELAAVGLVVDSNGRRMTRNNRRAIVWVAGAYKQKGEK